MPRRQATRQATNSRTYLTSVTPLNPTVRIGRGDPGATWKGHASRLARLERSYVSIGRFAHGRLSCLYAQLDDTSIRQKWRGRGKKNERRRIFQCPLPSVNPDDRRGSSERNERRRPYCTPSKTRSHSSLPWRPI